MRQIDLATEDALSEAVALRLIAELPGLTPGMRLRRSGNGYLRSRMRSFCEMARNRPILVVTDLDTLSCPMQLRAMWLRGLRHPSSLLLRVAVREVESWLMADHESIAGLLGRNAATRLPSNPDSVGDPKALLLRIARYAPRGVRFDLCPADGAAARQGLGYNARLCAFVASEWDPSRAASRSESLRRARDRLRQVANATLPG